MKALKKENIIVQFHALRAKFNIIEEKNINLEQEKTSRIEAINLLEETIKILKEQANTRIADKKTKNVQTDTSKLEGEKSEVCLCGDCDYIADCIQDFNEHTYSPDEDNETPLFTCNFCDESFQTLPEVMKHNKVIHTRNVQHCKQYLKDDFYCQKPNLTSTQRLGLT